MMDEDVELDNARFTIRLAGAGALVLGLVLLTIAIVLTGNRVDIGLAALLIAGGVFSLIWPGPAARRRVERARQRNLPPPQ